MFNYLDSVWQRNPDIELGALLGDLSLDVSSDGRPADPAVMEVWEKAVTKAIDDPIPSLN